MIGRIYGKQLITSIALMTSAFVFSLAMCIELI